MLSQFLGSYSTEFFLLVGAAITIYYTYIVVTVTGTFFYKHFLRSVPDYKAAGAWAIVTGCTDGIGKQYSEQLAAMGMNIVLMSRTLSKLEDMAKEIEQRYNVKTKVIQADFSRQDIYEDIEPQFAGLDIGVLVNNVGMSYRRIEYFHKITEEDFCRRMINLNCTSVAKMTEIAMKSMAPKGKGYVINVGSAAGDHPYPLLSLYSGTKAMGDFFTRSLHYEYANTNIVFQHTNPGYVTTKMSRRSRVSVNIPTPEDYVRNALRVIGCGIVNTGYWCHDVILVYMMMTGLAFHHRTFFGLYEKFQKKRAAELKEQKSE